MSSLIKKPAKAGFFMELIKCGLRVVNQVVSRQVTYDDAEGHHIDVVTTALGEYRAWHRSHR